ncbi:hypothetical protein A2V49_02390 [candidate division WWE3 bacterium RBG_19FT_COMBO_34_6]|uniref:Rod shape-determining protein MreD n=1 Tax=candidate division WWE3 bacterium RBG_19FT_COMBO_34_6 TaxID=1802612 RepID=A0A1F4UN78_UNCKA|nr:MAG: hypothetical protein A2V49_02390 [candidate division WWE3 bacterium RBG_19FT_COMBO_34_6]
MKKIFLVLIVSLILVFIENSFSYEFLGRMLNPSLILALSFAFVLTGDDKLALFTGLFGGIFTDFIGTWVIGSSSTFFVVSIYISIILKTTMFKGKVFQLVLITLCTLFYKFIFNLADFNFSLSYILGAALTMLCSSIFFYVISKISTKYLSTEYRIKA